MTTTAYKQDLPPEGGYQKIVYQRIPPKSYLNGWGAIAAFLGVTAGACYLYALNWKVVHQNEIERRSAHFAILPLLLAERDREYLKQLRRNRDEEATLMANVEGWKVGTLYGEPIYHTLPEDTLFQPTYHEYYVHAHFRDFAKRAFLSMWS